MKPLIASVALCALVAALPAHADSFFQIEAGIGVARINDMGDGTWIQQGASNNRETRNTPAFMLGLTGPVYASGSLDLRWHADYVYLGEFSASVDGVPDEFYDPAAHRVLPAWAKTGERYSPFNGHGHMQGIALTLDAGYSWHGWRLGAEVGPWLYWQTWHESLYALDDRWHDLSHRTQMQVGYVVGASVARGNLAVSYRYYGTPVSWDPYPGLARGAHVLMLQYRF